MEENSIEQGDSSGSMAIQGSTVYNHSVIFSENLSSLPQNMDVGEAIRANRAHIVRLMFDSRKWWVARLLLWVSGAVGLLFGAELVVPDMNTDKPIHVCVGGAVWTAIVPLLDVQAKRHTERKRLKLEAAGDLQRELYRVQRVELLQQDKGGRVGVKQKAY